jgi:hypothetical protein
MAVGKEAPIPNIAAAALAHRKSLEAVVEEFTQTFASLSATVIKRRLKGAEITMPHFGNDDVIECKTETKSSAAAASSDEILL